MGINDKSLYSTDWFDDDLVVTLDDGFQRLGEVESPFTIREPPEGPPPENKRRAQEIHEERSHSEQRRDEQRHEPITRDLEEWRNNLHTRDFPGVDTIPAGLRQSRANAAVSVARQKFGVGSVERDVDFEDEGIRGRYFRGVSAIEVNTSPSDFPGWQEAVTLAHEVGHAIDDNAAVKTGFASERGEVFDSKAEEQQARKLSERVRGPITEPAVPGKKSYRESRSEKVADTVAAAVIEPERSASVAPDATDQVRSTFEEFFEAVEDELDQIEWGI